MRFRLDTDKPVVVELVPRRDGGLLEGWTLTGPDGAGFYEASGAALEFGDLGLLLEVTVSGITERGLEIPIDFDNTIYTGGKRLGHPEFVAIGDEIVPTPGQTPTPTFTPTSTSTPAAGRTVTPSSRTIHGAIDSPDESDEYNIIQDSSGPVEISVSGIPLAEPGSTNRLRICALGFPGDDCVTLEDDRRKIWRQVPRNSYIISVQSTSEYNNFAYTITITY